jgi:hypothetical protein
MIGAELSSDVQSALKTRKSAYYLQDVLRRTVFKNGLVEESPSYFFSSSPTTEEPHLHAFIRDEFRNMRPY